jgi:hypothetical protein
MPDKVDDCVESVLEDNPDYSESRAYAICNAQFNSDVDPGDVEAESVADLAPQLDVQADGPCWDGYVMVGTKTENGREVPNCVPEEDADEMREQAGGDAERAAAQYRATVRTLDMLAHTSPEWQRFGGDWGIGWAHTESGELVYQQESFTDYPEAAKENAQMALDAREETGDPNDCGRREGWMRANQLADGEAISRDTVGRMASFARHEDNSDMSDEEGRADCGWMMFKAWGGDEGIEWAQDKLDELEDDTEEQARVSGNAVVVDGLSGEAQRAIDARYNADVLDFQQEVPDDAVSISDRDEAPDDAQVVSGPRGGLYYVPNGGGVTTDDPVQEYIEDLPDTIDSEDDSEKTVQTAKDMAAGGIPYTDTVEAIENNVSGLNEGTSRDIRETAYNNQVMTIEVSGEVVEASPVAQNPFDDEQSDIRQLAEEDLSEQLTEEQLSELDEIGDTWLSMGAKYDENSMLNTGTAPLWSVVSDETGNNNAPGDADAPINTSVSEDEREAIMTQAENTQEKLRELFGESVPVQRGLTGGIADEIQQAAENGETIEIDARALESWTTMPDTAERFANFEFTEEGVDRDAGGVVLNTEVSTDDVWASSFTTPELAEDENEIVVGTDDTITIEPEDVYNPEDSDMADLYDDVGGR